MPRGENQPAAPQADVPRLRSLGPTYEPSLHGRHAAVLLQVLTDSSGNPAKNIALSGHYGSGKSSVILGVQSSLSEKDIGWVNLSLSSLGIDDTRRARVQDDGSLAPLTNLIQKEIVKQLLYRKAPADMPGSRYFRIDSFRAGPAAIWAATVAVGFFVIAVLFGLVQRVEKTGPQGVVTSHDWVPWAVVAGFGVLLGGIWFLGLRSLQNRVRVESVSAGGAAVQLSAKENSYFDEYLDEIVYFFQRTKTQVAIFEDLDRFKDPHIFETLRELNTVLNNSEQIKMRPVRFVYAVRDSIFEQLERDVDDDAGDGHDRMPASRLESAPAANRTKFFDLVVPMVPFLTHRSARDLVAEEFAESEDHPETALVNLVGVFLTDMRLIRNIRNEFEIYRASIPGEKGLKGLTADRLFAMMVYKNLHLEDFEAIRHGASTIDAAHRAFREMVKYQTGHQAAVSKSALDTAASPAAWDNRAKAAGERLRTVLPLVHRVSRRQGQPVLQFQGQNHELATLTDGAFWKALFESREGVQLLVPGVGIGTSLSFDDLMVLAGEAAAGLDERVDVDVARLERRSRTALETKNLVSKATMAQLMARTDLKMQHDGREQNLDEVVAGLVSPLAHGLIAKGYIDENYTLYCSDYHAIAISVSAMNFILHCVQPNVADHRFRFDEPASIDAVEKESDTRFLDGESVFNIEVFDHYLGTNPAKLDGALEKLVVRVGDDSTFLDAYLLDGGARMELISQLAPRWPRIFVHLIETAPLANTEQTALVDAALQNAARTVDYETSDRVANFISGKYGDMDALVADVGAEKAADTAMVLGALGAEIGVLQLLGDSQLAAVIEAGLYPVTRPNLASAVGPVASLAMDVLAATNDTVYKHVLGELHDYLDVLTDDETTVHDADQFVAVLADVLAADESHLEEVANRASEACEVADLDDLDDAAWSALVAAGRYASTTWNVSQFVRKYGVTEKLADDLSDRDLTEAGDVEVEPRLALAYAFAESTQLTEEDTVRLIQQLDLPDGLTPDRLGETGLTIVPALLMARLLPDVAETYALISDHDYRFRESYFAASSQLATYVTQLPLSKDDLPKVMKSRRVATGVKRAIVDDIDFVRERLTRAGAIAICEWADRGQATTADLLIALAQAGAPAERILSLLEPHLPNIDLGALDQILTALGEEYEPLTHQGHHRPKLKNRHGTEQLLDELTKRERVSSYAPGLLGGIRVNMRH